MKTILKLTKSKVIVLILWFVVLASFSSESFAWWVNVPPTSTNQNEYPSPADAIYRYLKLKPIGDLPDWLIGVRVGHAALFYRIHPNSELREVIQANGNDYKSGIETWQIFLRGKNGGEEKPYWGAYSQKRVTQTDRRAILFTATSSDCLGIDYNFYTGWKSPGVSFRCDGLVEYCYEQAFYYCGDSYWADIHVGIVPQDFYFHELHPQLPAVYCNAHNKFHDMTPALQMEWINDESQSNNGSGDKHDRPGAPQGQNAATDSQRPTVEITEGPNGTWVKNPVKFKSKGTDNCSPNDLIFYAEQWENNGTWSRWLQANGLPASSREYEKPIFGQYELSSQKTLAEGWYPYGFKVKTKDLSGNESLTYACRSFGVDNTAPTNPLYPCNAWKTSNKNISISNNVTQNTTANPYFEWSGASDSLSGVSGYSVYYGTNSSGEPGTTQEQIDAFYDAGSDPGSAGTYYLRVRTFDNAGNYSSPATLFIVKYSPPAPPPNHDPELSNPDLTPTSGNTSTTFTYSVKYYDQDGDVPSVKNVNIIKVENNNPLWEQSFAMTLSSGLASDGVYTYSTQFEVGEYIYQFYFEDGKGGKDVLPGPTIYWNGPTVTSAPPHTVTKPNTPSGPSTGVPHQSISFTTGGSTCSQGHSVEYRFSTCNSSITPPIDGNKTTWNGTSTSITFDSTGTFYVYAQARCSVDNSITSDWSNAHQIIISEAPPPPEPDIRTPIDDIDFGEQWVGFNRDRYTTIYNDGTAGLMIYSISRISGSSDFTYIVPTTPFEILSEDSRSITIRFNPSSPGTKSATFNVNSNDPDEPNVTFTVTGEGKATPNRPPNKPDTPSGPLKGYIDISCTFTTSTTDPDRDRVAYRFDWGDGNISDWTEFVSSGSSASKSHSYLTAGTYQVKAQAKDENGEIQEQWSDAHEITISPPAAIYVPDDYPTIQSAVDAANPGDTIIVRDSIYTENISINKNHLTIKSENGAESTIIQPVDPDDNVFKVTADYVNVEGFTIRESNSWGIFLDGVKHCNILNNNLIDNSFGIILAHSTNNNLKNNHVNSKFRGVSLHSSNNNVLENNNILNSWCGFLLDNSNSNILTKNTITLTKSESIYLNLSNNNIIYLNDFKDDTNDVFSFESANLWNSERKINYAYNGDTYTNYLGNYWSNYTGNDINGDGIGDAPYFVDKYRDTDSDNYPLTVSFDNYQIDEWPMFRCNSRHNGYSTSSAPDTDDVLWTYQICGGFQSSPAVANGMVYIGSNTGYVYALDALSGDLIWSFAIGSNVLSSPAVADGKIYIGSDNGYFYALDAINGDIVWKYQTIGKIYTSPAVINGKVFFGAGYRNCPTMVYALDAQNGNLLWQYSVSSNAALISSPTIANGKVFFGSIWHDQSIYALDENTGKLIWNTKINGNVFSSPAVANGMVYIGCGDWSPGGCYPWEYGHTIYALDESDGHIVWEYETGWCVVSSPAIADGKVFVGSYDKYLYALDALSGDLIWKYETAGRLGSSPAIADNKVFITSVNHIWDTLPHQEILYALDIDTGSLVWSYILGFAEGHGFSSSPAIAYGNVYVGSLSGRVYAFGSSFSTIDSDSDGLRDNWEIEYFGNLEQRPNDDYDNDNLTNLEEYKYNTNPIEWDTDGDGYSDGEEIETDSDPLDRNSIPKTYEPPNLKTLRMEQAGSTVIITLQNAGELPAYNTKITKVKTPRRISCLDSLPILLDSPVQPNQTTTVELHFNIARRIRFSFEVEWEDEDGNVYYNR